MITKETNTLHYIYINITLCQMHMRNLPGWLEIRPAQNTLSNKTA